MSKLSVLKNMSFDEFLREMTIRMPDPIFDVIYWCVNRKMERPEWLSTKGMKTLHKIASGKKSKQSFFLKADRCMKIDHLAYDMTYFNAWLFNATLSLVVYALMENAIPIILIEPWNRFFEQPFMELNMESKDKTVKCDKEVFYEVLFPWSAVYDKNLIHLWSEVFKQFARFNQETVSYIEKEKELIFQSNRRVLGCLCRGTDYTTLKPKGHPVQPEINQVLAMVERKLRDLDIEYIYLATEEEKIYKEFEHRFPGRILVNKRTYYDEVYHYHSNMYIKDCHFNRDDDDYLKGLEYLSSLSILAQCNALVAGNCGGTGVALVMNDNRYEDVTIFDLGLYE